MGRSQLRVDVGWISPSWLLARDHIQFLENPLSLFPNISCFLFPGQDLMYHRRASNLELQILIPSAPLLGFQAGATTRIVFRIEARALFILGKYSTSVAHAQLPLSLFKAGSPVT